VNVRWVIAMAMGYALASAPTCHAQTTTSATAITDVDIELHAEEPQHDGVGLLAADSSPVNDREWESLGLLASTANAATVAAGGSGDGEADLADGRNGAGNDSAPAAGLSYGGLAPTQNAATLDGLSMEQNFSSRPRGGGRGSASGGPVSGASFAQGALRSYRVMPGTYSAEFGGAAGAMLAITSRTGTDTWHGEFYSTVRLSAFDATNPYSVVTRYRDDIITNSLVKPQDTTAQLGGHISVPLKQFFRGKQGKKLALFASWEEMLRNDPAISSPETANFYALTPSKTALLGNRGVTTAARNAALNYLDSLTGTVPRFSTRGLGFVRIDDAASTRDHIVATYTHNRFDLPAGSGFRSASNAVINSGVASVGDSFVHVDAGAAHWLHAFSPKLRNTLRLQFVRDFEFEVPHAPLPQEPSVSPGGFAPEIEIAPNGFTYGTPANLGRTAYPDEKRAQAVEQVEWLRGRHQFIAGFDWSRIDDRVASYTNADGTFLYDSGSTGDSEGGLVDWITDYTFNVNAYPNGGCPSITATVHDPCFRSYTQSFGPAQTRFVTHTFAVYAQDAFRIRHDLLLTLGARYEYVLLPFPQTPNKVLDEDLRGLATQVQGATASFPEDRNNVGPRAAISWTPGKGKGITARLGYGLFYGRLAGTTVQSALADTALLSTTLQIRIRPTTEVSCPQGGAVPDQGFGYPCAFDTTLPSAVVETSATTLFAKTFRLPAVQRATLSLERELGKHAFVRAAYAMALATQLPSTIDLNIAPATSSATFTIQGGDGYPGLHTGQSFPIPLYTQRRLTQYGPITALVSNANATYHAATFEAELRSWHGLGVRGSFTFSRAIDYAPLISGTPQTNGQFDPFRNGYDKGLSTLQFPERFSGDMVYRSHITQGPRALRKAFDAWRIAAIASAGSGAPYSYEISGGTYLSGGHETINGAGGATYLPTVGRNTLRLPARGTVDLRLERPFELHKGVRISAFAEAFNLLNKRNLTRVETRAFLPEPASISPPPAGCPVITGAALVFQSAAAISCEGLTTPAFGQPTSSTSGVSRERELELGLRLQF
jgi:hypothetical protein